MKKYKTKRKFFTKEIVGYIRYNEFNKININGSTIYTNNLDENGIKNLKYALYDYSGGHMDLVVVNLSTLTLYGRIYNFISNNKFILSIKKNVNNISKYIYDNIIETGLFVCLIFLLMAGIISIFRYR